jgi:hypothetical protein
MVAARGAAVHSESSLRLKDGITMPQQAKSPSLAQDLLMLGDVYVTLLWVAVQRLRHGAVWPWEDALSAPTSKVIEMPRPEAGEDEREPEPAARRES